MASTAPVVGGLDEGISKLLCKGITARWRRNERRRGLPGLVLFLIVRLLGIIIGKLGEKEVGEQRSENEGVRGGGRIYFGRRGLT